MRILLIEDNPRLAELILQGVGEAGYQVDMVQRRSERCRLRSISTTRYGYSIWDCPMAMA